MFCEFSFPSRKQKSFGKFLKNFPPSSYPEIDLGRLLGKLLTANGHKSRSLNGADLNNNQNFETPSFVGKSLR